MSKMKAKIEIITVERAKYYLSVNISNRPINRVTVNKYLSEMNNGTFKEGTGETIKISEEGYLLDGQHRLTALILTNNKSFEFLIAYDLDKGIFDVLDSGRGRGASDIFALSNIPNSTLSASIIRGYLSFKAGKYGGKAMGRDLISNTNASLLAKYNENPIYYNGVGNKAISFYNGFSRILPTATIGYFYLLFNESNSEKCEQFFSQLCKSENITNSSIKTLGSFLIRDKISLKKISPVLRNAFIIKTWNAFILNKEIKTLKYDSNVESFPTIL